MLLAASKTFIRNQNAANHEGIVPALRRPCDYSYSTAQALASAFVFRPNQDIAQHTCRPIAQTLELL